MNAAQIRQAIDQNDPTIHYQCPFMAAGETACARSFSIGELVKHFGAVHLSTNPDRIARTLEDHGGLREL